MTLSDRIQLLLEARGLSQSELEKTLGFGKGTMTKWKGTTAPSADKLLKIAEYFDVTLDYLVTGNEGTLKKGTKLTSKDEREIERILEQTRDQLLSQKGLMFDGDPATPEAIDSILAAMQVGMEMAKKRNKEKYTPKKYKED